MLEDARVKRIKKKIIKNYKGDKKGYDKDIDILTETMNQVLEWDDRNWYSRYKVKELNKLKKEIGERKLLKKLFGYKELGEKRSVGMMKAGILSLARESNEEFKMSDDERHAFIKEWLKDENLYEDLMAFIEEEDLDVYKKLKIQKLRF